MNHLPATYQPAFSRQPVPLPLFACAVPAGFPSPADDYMEGQLDLNEHLIKHLTATYFVRAAGDSMIGAGIHPGDILVVDRKKPATKGAIVIASINGEFTVKRLEHKNDQPFLMPENPDFRLIPVGENDDVHIFGVVTHSIHALK